MNWFAYLECAALPCIFIVEIRALTLLYLTETKNGRDTKHIL